MRNGLILCALVLLFSATPAWSAAPKPVAPVCSKIMTTATLNSLTGSSFTGFGACGWNDPADTTPPNPYLADITLHFVVGAAQVSSQWNLYSHPKLVKDAITPVSGIGTKAVEVNSYIAVVKGTTFFQMWAGNNGIHLTYPQLETVAKYIVSKLK